jgi:outer membrane protein TolC
MLNQVELNLSFPKSDSDFLKQYDLDSLNLIDQQLVFETKYLPQLKVFFNTGFNAVETNGIERKFGLSAGFSFSLPLFDGGQKNLTWQQNQISQNTISNYRRHSELSLDMMLYNTLSRIKSLKQNLHELNVQIGEYQNLIAISREGLQKGDISIIEYLTLLKNFIDLKKSEIEKQINYQMEINNYNYWNW